MIKFQNWDCIHNYLFSVVFVSLRYSNLVSKIMHLLEAISHWCRANREYIFEIHTTSPATELCFLTTYDATARSWHLEWSIMVQWWWLYWRTFQLSIENNLNCLKVTKHIRFFLWGFVMLYLNFVELKVLIKILIFKMWTFFLIDHPL